MIDLVAMLRAKLLPESPAVGVLRIGDADYYGGGLGGSGLTPALRSGRHWKRWAWIWRRTVDSSVGWTTWARWPKV